VASRKSNKTSVGRRVNALVAGLELSKASRDDLVQVAEQVCVLGRDAVKHLARSTLRPGPSRREKVASLLACLDGKWAMWALEQLREVAASRRLSAMERVWLSVTVRRMAERLGIAAGGGQGDGERVPESGAVTADPTDLLLWRDEVDALDSATQQQVVATLLASGDPTFLPFLEAALSLGNPRLDAAVAEGLAHFATHDALPLVRGLVRHADPQVRKHARATLVALARNGVGTHDLFVAATEAPNAATCAFACEPDAVGAAAVLFAGPCGIDLVQYAMVLIDPIEVGVAETWGECDLTEDELQECMAHLADESGEPLTPMDLDTARALVAAAEAFTRAQGRDLPAEHFAWRRLIGPAPNNTKLPIVFGPHCSECGRRMHRRDVTRGGRVAGDVALCARCAEQPRKCAVCGRELHVLFDHCELRRGAHDDQVECVCMACSRLTPRRQ